MNYCRICKKSFDRGEVRASYKNSDSMIRYYCMACWRRYYQYQNENTSMLTNHSEWT